RMTDVRRSESGFGDAADREDAAPARELAGVREAGSDLGARRPPVGCLRAGMRRDDVPKEHVVLDAELVEGLVDDRCGRLGRPVARQLALGRERDAGDARASVPGGLADEEVPSVRSLLEKRVEPGGEPWVAVLVERFADPRASQTPYQCSH